MLGCSTAALFLTGSVAMRLASGQRVHDGMLLDPAQRAVFNQAWLDFGGRTWVDPLCQVETHREKTSAGGHDFFNQTFVYVVTETVGDYPSPYFSEKTWKGFLNHTPLLMVNAMYSLRKLQDLGFATFDRWWDENYDTLPTVGDRIDAVVGILTELSKFDQFDLLEMRAEMIPVLEHNAAHYRVFKENQLEELRKKL